MICTIEIGTSRTRVRLLDRNDEIRVESIRSIGARDVAKSGRNDGLKKQIREMIDEQLAEQNIDLSDIEDVVAHGMVTADIGLYKVEHAPSPVDIDTLAGHTLRILIPEIFPKPILLIPGVKNNVESVTMNTLDDIDFMRGEETQIMGILHSPDILKFINLPFYFLMLSSFTKLVFVNELKQIDLATTNVTGQLFPAIMKETFLAGMLPDYFPDVATMNKNLVCDGYEYVEKVGFPRALMLIRLGQYFMEMSREDAMSFFEGMIAYLDLSKLLLKIGSGTKLDIVISGDSYRREVYRFLLEECLGFKGKIKIINDSTINKVTVKGALEILKRSRRVDE